MKKYIVSAYATIYNNNYEETNHIESIKTIEINYSFEVAKVIAIEMQRKYSGYKPAGIANCEYVCYVEIISEGKDGNVMSYMRLPISVCEITNEGYRHFPVCLEYSTSNNDELFN